MPRANASYAASRSESPVGRPAPFAPLAPLVPLASRSESHPIPSALFASRSESSICPFTAFVARPSSRAPFIARVNNRAHHHSVSCGPTSAVPVRMDTRQQRSLATKTETDSLKMVVNCQAAAGQQITTSFLGIRPGKWSRVATLSQSSRLRPSQVLSDWIVVGNCQAATKWQIATVFIGGLSDKWLEISTLSQRSNSRPFSDPISANSDLPSFSGSTEFRTNRQPQPPAPHPPQAPAAAASPRTSRSRPRQRHRPRTAAASQPAPAAGDGRRKRRTRPPW